MSEKITLSAIKADVGGFVGHTAVHPGVTAACHQRLLRAREDGVLVDFEVGSVGDDQHLLLSHRHGIEHPEIHRVAWEAFQAGLLVAKSLNLCDVGQDLLKEDFQGTLRGLGPGYAELEFEERRGETVVVLRADKCAPGAWNLPLYRIFADPFNTPGLVMDPEMRAGYTFAVLDTIQAREIALQTPDEIHDLLALIGAPSRYVVSRIYRRWDGEIAAAASTQRLSQIAGKYVGKDDPVLVIRCQAGFPAVGEALEPFAFPHAVAGWMRGSYNGPLMPCAIHQASPARFDGPPRAVAVGFQIANGTLVGPRDLFSDPAFHRSRELACEIADYLRRHGPFEPHRLAEAELEYTSLPQILEKLRSRFIEAEAVV